VHLYLLWWCADISLAVYRRAVREGTDIQFVCPACKLQPPSPNISFDIADVSFDRTGGVEDECLSGGIGKMRKCGMRNAESKMRNEKCGMHMRNGV